MSPAAKLGARGTVFYEIRYFFLSGIWTLWGRFENLSALIDALWLQDVGASSLRLLGDHTLASDRVVNWP